MAIGEIAAAPSFHQVPGGSLQHGWGLVAGGSTPAEQWLDRENYFTSLRYEWWRGVMAQNYTGRDVTVRTFVHSSDSNINRNARMGFGFRNLNDGGQVTASHSYTITYATSPNYPGFARMIAVHDFDIAAGDMDGLAAGDPFLLLVARDATHADDDVVDSSIASIILLEK